MHNIQIGMATLLAALLGSCSQSTMNDSIPESTGNKIVFTTPIAPTSRTATIGLKTVFTNGDQMGVFGIPRVTEGSATILHSNLKYQLENSQWETENPIALPPDGSNVNFYAYYPFIEMESPAMTFDFSVDTDQATNGYNQSDLLIAKNETVKTNEATVIELAFTHALALIEVDMTMPEGVTAEKATIKAYPTATVDLSAGTATAKAEGEEMEMADISLSKQADGTFRGVVPVQEIKGKCIRIIGSNGAPYWYIANKAVILEANKLNPFTFTVAN